MEYICTCGVFIAFEERIFSEEEAIKAAGCVWLDVKGVQLLIEVTVFVFEQVGLSQSHRYSSQDVAVVGGAGGCAHESESVGCTYVDGVCICIMSYRVGLVCVLRSCVLVCTCVLV